MPAKYKQSGYWLMHEGSRELAVVESRGIRIDQDRLKESMSECDRRIAELSDELKSDDLMKEWRRRYGAKTNLTSGDQLGAMLFGYLKLPGGHKTATGKWSTSDEHLQKIDHPIVKKYTEIQRISKLRGTFLQGIQTELVNGLLHPSFALHLTKSFRSNAFNPNFQNFPVRDKDSARIIRSCFIPREGRVLIEVDYSAIEVRVACCYHKDPTMETYIKDETKDMHRDMAMEIYKVPKEHVQKNVRHAAKNMYVFPQFYGDYYVSCAKKLWEAAGKEDMQVDGVQLLDHLRANGIRKLGACDPKESPVAGTFEHHLKKVEDNFWNVRFPIYTQWKRRWYQRYLDKGYFDILTGFRVQNHHTRKEVINYPVQGAAFHCLLWSLITLQRKLRTYKMKTCIVGQVHDSIIADVPVKEVPTFLRMAREVMIDELMSVWGWISVPLAIEAEGSDKSWYDKKEMKIE